MDFDSKNPMQYGFFLYLHIPSLEIHIYLTINNHQKYTIYDHYFSAIIVYMANVSIREYKRHAMRHSYMLYSKCLVQFQSHIERCLQDHIITLAERNNYMRIINDVIHQMGIIYNTCMEKNNNETKIINFDSLNMNNITCEDVFELSQLHHIIGHKDSLLTFHNQNPYESVKNTLLENIGTKIGFFTLDHALLLLLGNGYKEIYLKNNQIEFEIVNTLFVPLGFSIMQHQSVVPLSVIKTPASNKAFMDHMAIVHIQKDSRHVFCFPGYFLNDSLNIAVKTSQICNHWIYQKKREFLNHIVQKNIVEERFARIYIKNMPIVYIIGLNKDQFCDQIKTDFIYFIKLNKMSFMNLMKEFVKDDDDHQNRIYNMYNIIRLLLMGNEDNINAAGILFGISKDKKSATDNSVYDLIYRHLSFHQQLRLKKTSVNLKQEIERINTITHDDIDFKKQIGICRYMPDAVKRIAYEKADEMSSSNNEYHKQLLYVRTLLNYPWPSPDDDKIFVEAGKTNKHSIDFLDNVVGKLDQKVYGHRECKDSIKELLGKWIKKPNNPGTAIGLAGPPGVGKTLIAKAIGDAIGIPFVQITLGGQNDGELLHGHGYTYSGAQPGMIVKKMVEAGNARCVFYFDELDKACKKHDSNEIYSILIHITDPNTNKEFQDRFFQDIKFPLDKALFIFSYNDSNLIDTILMDRITEIDVKPFRTVDKLEIIQKFILREMSEMVDFPTDLVSIDHETSQLIIENYTNEAGVRDLKRKFEKLFLKLNIDRIYQTGAFANKKRKKTIHLKFPLIEKYLGQQKIDIQQIHTQDAVGVINGLYATDQGQGGVIPIQIYNNFASDGSKFALKLTGQQRKVMRESVECGYTTAMHCVKSHIRSQYVAKHPYGFHIHTPSGAVPKDGPSAGCAFTAAFISRILDKEIRHDIAITGEITLTGEVTKIGGLRYKLPGAKRAGVKTVLISSENKDDVQQIKNEHAELFDDTFSVILVDNIIQVLEHVLVDFDPNVIY